MSKKLISAIREKNFDKVKELITPENINECDINGNMPLHFACMRATEEIAKYLIDSGADFDDEGFDATPLSLAAYHGMYEIVKLLVYKGANVNYINDNNQTILHQAALYAYQSGDKRIYEFLEPLVSDSIKAQVDNVYGETSAQIFANVGKDDSELEPETEIEEEVAAAGAGGGADDKDTSTFKGKIAAKKDEGERRR